MSIGSVREIPLTQGKIALVDESDYETLSAHKWRATRNPKSGNWYAVRCLPRQPGEPRKNLLMHRFLCPGSRKVDHRDGDSLNNRCSNLRPCSNSQNLQNARRPATNTSGFKGVTAYWKRWKAGIWINGKQKHLGTFRSPKIAALAYDFAALKYFGEFARLNFPIAEYAL